MELQKLTPRQREIFDYIRNRIVACDVPTFQEIADHFGIESKNGVTTHIKVLVRKGWLYRAGVNRSRSLRLTQTYLESLTPPPGGKGAA